MDPASLMTAPHLVILSLMVCTTLESVVSSEVCFKGILCFHSGFYLLLSVIWSSKTGIWSLAIPGLEREDCRWKDSNCGAVQPHQFTAAASGSSRLQNADTAAAAPHLSTATVQDTAGHRA